AAGEEGTRVAGSGILEKAGRGIGEQRKGAIGPQQTGQNIERASDVSLDLRQLAGIEPRKCPCFGIDPRDLREIMRGLLNVEAIGAMLAVKLVQKFRQRPVMPAPRGAELRGD